MTENDEKKKNVTEKLKKSLHKLRAKELDDLNQARALRNEHEQELLSAKKQDDLSSKSSTDEEGRQIDLWKKAMQLADKALDPSAKAYDDWRAGMLSLLGVYAALQEALANSINQKIWFKVSMLADQGIYMASEWFKNKLKTSPVIDLPVLQHAIKFSDDDKIQVEPLTRSDKGKTGTLDAVFREGVDLWLEKQGYTRVEKTIEEKDEHGVTNTRVEKTNEYVDSSTKAPLTKATFDRLMADPENCFGNYVAGDSELQFRPRP